MRELLPELPIGRTTVYAEIAAGRFPRPVRIGLRAVAWRRADVEEWKARLLRAG